MRFSTLYKNLNGQRQPFQDSISQWFLKSKHKFATPYHPASRGLVEGYNGIIWVMLWGNMLIWNMFIELKAMNRSGYFHYLKRFYNYNHIRLFNANCPTVHFIYAPWFPITEHRFKECKPQYTTKVEGEYVHRLHVWKEYYIFFLTWVGVPWILYWSMLPQAKVSCDQNYMAYWSFRSDIINEDWAITSFSVWIEGHNFIACCQT